MVLSQEEEEFVDNEAGADGEGGEEGDEEGEGDGDGDGEGEGDGEEGSADSSEEEEGSEQNEYEEDGFVVDEEEAENDGGEDSDPGVRKKRRKRRRDFALDEEDYMLLEDNQVTVSDKADGRSSRAFCGRCCCLRACALSVGHMLYATCWTLAYYAGRNERHACMAGIALQKCVCVCAGV